VKSAPPTSGVRLLLIATALIAVGLGAPLALRALSGSGAVTVELISPVPGSVVSNTITMSATASSTSGPIAWVEFYADDKLIGVVNSNNQEIPRPPTNLRVVTP
jgi:hypothetical protein